ncbi:MAG TPA: four helix bundle protein [Rhodanobacteraceae bacterium]|nr:four helix bundle protein [Rhodanobacteraceae bacterium]
MSITHFRDLDVWRVAMDMTCQVYELTADFPREERYGLSAQIQRAAVSVPSNIAEGNARQSRREYAHFLSIASGSIAEVQTQLLLALQLGLTYSGSVEPALELAERVSKMLYRLHEALASPPGPRSPVPGPRISETTKDNA